MAGTNFRKSTALAALAAGIIFIASPAMARPVDAADQVQNGGRHGDRGSWNRGGEAGHNGGSWRQQPQHVAPAPQAQPQPQQVPHATPQAQPQHQRGWNGGNPQTGNGWQGGWRGQAPAAQQAPQHHAPPHHAQQHGWNSGQTQQHNGWNGHRPQMDQHRNARQDERHHNRGWQGHQNGNPHNVWQNHNNWRGHDNWRHDNRQWSHDWRRDRRYDWRDYRNGNRDFYRANRYYAPYQGYSYRRLSVGIFLQPLFFRNDYWINDPWAFRLPPAYGPYRWVRYYDDVLLVNIYNGEVVDVIRDFFW